MATKDNVIPLLGESWAELLWNEFNESYMRYIMNQVSLDRKKKTVLPDSKNVFKAYKECPFDITKVCIIGQDPYPTKGDANGLAFSVNNDINRKALPGSLRNIFKELENDLGFEGHRNIVHDPDLVRWSRQGVMLLNTALTTIEGNPNAHINLGWSYFTGKTLELLAEKDNMIFVGWGSYAKKVINTYGNVMRNHFITSAHPSPLSAHRGFFGSKPFSKVNQILVEIGDSPIKW